MDFPPHSHDYGTYNVDEFGCHDDQSHRLDPRKGEPSITINGSPIYQIEDDVQDDPITGDQIDIVQNPIDTQMEQT
jgi:hypothetical protein